MNEPIWLSDERVQQLLHFLVDRLDRADAQGKAIIRALRLDDASFPALYRAEYESDKEQLWSYVEQLAKFGWFQLKLDRSVPGKASYELNPRVVVADVGSVRAAAGRLTRRKSANELWREAVFAKLDSPDEIRETVARFLVNIPSRSFEEIVLKLNQLKNLVDEPLLLREVSARLFWGQSKVLDGRQALVAAILGVDDCPYPEMPVQLQVFLPKTGFAGVLFIENQATFEQAARDSSTEFAGLALIFASGFKGCAKRLRTSTGASLYFAAHGALDSDARQKLTEWLFGGHEIPCWFWGDLDYSGMGILQALRSTFSNLLAWPRGYGPMLALLEDGGGHDPRDAGKSAQRPVDVTGCPYADTELIPAMNRMKRFVDQELG